MSTYFPVALYALDGTFCGYAISGPLKLQSTNVYQEGEEDQLNEQLARLNQDVDLKAHWPHPQEEAVQALLADETFMPVQYKMAEVVDDDNSYYAYKQVPEVNEFGDPTGHMVDGEELDEEASVINYKMAKVPERPTDVMWRIKQACEHVARQRAGC